MTEQICECGHKIGCHGGARHKLYCQIKVKGRLCPCKKFQPKDVCKYCGKKLRNTNWGSSSRNPSGMHDICSKRSREPKNHSQGRSEQAFNVTHSGRPEDKPDGVFTPFGDFNLIEKIELARKKLRHLKIDNQEYFDIEDELFKEFIRKTRKNAETTFNYSQKIDKIIDEFLDSPYFNEMWEEQYALLRKRLKEQEKN